MVGAGFEWRAEELPSVEKWATLFGSNTSRYGRSLTEWVRYMEAELDATVHEMETVDNLHIGGQPDSENNKSPCTFGMYIKGFAIFHIYKVVHANPHGPQGLPFSETLSDGTVVNYTNEHGNNPFLVCDITYMSYCYWKPWSKPIVHFSTSAPHWAADFWANGLKSNLQAEANRIMGTKHDALKSPQVVSPLAIPPTIVPLYP